jgi:hypothetical protein
MLDVQQRIDELAFLMVHMSPDQRVQLFREAFERTSTKHPGLDGIPPSIVVFVAAVYQRIAELERLPPGGSA